MKTSTLWGAQTDSTFGLGCPNAVNVPLTIGAAGRTDALPSGWGGNTTFQIGGNTALQAFHWFIDWFLLNKKEMMKSISGWWLVCCHFWLKNLIGFGQKVAELFALWDAVVCLLLIFFKKLLLLLHCESFLWKAAFWISLKTPLPTPTTLPPPFLSPEAIQGPKSHNDSPVSPWQGFQKPASFNVQYSYRSVWQQYTDNRKHTDKWFLLSQQKKKRREEGKIAGLGRRFCRVNGINALTAKYTEIQISSNNSLMAPLQLRWLVCWWDGAKVWESGHFWVMSLCWWSYKNAYNISVTPHKKRKYIFCCWQCYIWGWWLQCDSQKSRRRWWSWEIHFSLSWQLLYCKYEAKCGVFWRGGGVRKGHVVYLMAISNGINAPTKLHCVALLPATFHDLLQSYKGRTKTKERRVILCFQEREEKWINYCFKLLKLIYPHQINATIRLPVWRLSGCSGADIDVVRGWNAQTLALPLAHVHVTEMEDTFSSKVGCETTECGDGGCCHHVTQNSSVKAMCLWPCLNLLAHTQSRRNAIQPNPAEPKDIIVCE